MLLVLLLVPEATVSFSPCQTTGNVTDVAAAGALYGA